MPKREPEPHWKATHKAWYLNLRGEKIRLGPDKDKAWEEYHRLMAGKREIGPNVLVAELILEYLLWSKTHHKARTQEWYKDHLESFAKHIGRLKVQSLKPYHVEQWIEKRFPKTKNGTTIGNAMRTVVRVFNWAKKSGRISQSPLTGLERPTPTHRDVYLMPDEYKKLIAAIKNKRFLDLVVLMRETGCRPQEARHVEARHFDRHHKCLVIPKEEAKGGPKGATEDRVILLNDKALEIVQRLAMKNPEGKLLLNTRSQPWTANAFNQQCIKFSKKLSFHICPYAIRHTFATDAIIRGVDIVTISELMAHADLSMLKRIYQRTPKINQDVGRDHYADAWSCALAGCGIRGGAVFGRTDEDGVKVAEGEVNAGDLAATIFQAVGIDPAKHYQVGPRPVPLAKEDARPIAAILS